MPSIKYFFPYMKQEQLLKVFCKSNAAFFTNNSIIFVQLKVKLVLKEWQFSDGSHSLNGFHVRSRQTFTGSSNYLLRTGRKINITVVEGKELSGKDRNGRCNPYVKLQYGKVDLSVSY